MSVDPTMMPPAPNSMTVFIPPGMTPAMFVSLQSSLVTIGIVVAVVAGIMLWDYMNLLPDELSLWASGGLMGVFKSPAAIAFVVLRISGVVATLSALWFTSIQSDHCQAAVVISQVGVVLVVASSGIIFGYRVFAIWSGNRIVLATLVVAFLGMLGCWISVASTYSALNGPPTPFGSNCQMQPIATWAPIGYASSVGFDIIILVLTLVKMGANRASASNTVGFIIYRDSVLYFAATTVTNVVVLSIQALGPEWNLVKPTAVPFSTLITAAAGARVFLNLRLFKQRQENPTGGSGWSRSGGASSNLSKGAYPSSVAGSRHVPSEMPLEPIPKASHQRFPSNGIQVSKTSYVDVGNGYHGRTDSYGERKTGADLV